MSVADTKIQRYLSLVESVMGGAEDYDLLCLRGKSITERNEFVALVEEFRKESLNMRIYQVCGSVPVVVTILQWCLGYAERYPDVAASWLAFVAYSNKNNFGLKFPMDHSLVLLIGVFEGVHNLVIEHRQKQAA
ncbi:hypothetical protein [Streptomyces sp. CHB9.2]|uniref:hypothetical protein n=1 Tax=Streptomyces sp. CHB9.2 TaxID=2841670 RepID=UPI0020946BD4|nr:hypothetical protein [Streptomyces sp. CHB9.2]MCO6704875.1 hypothetical protein [Streptomyces sp. CHB9.2]